MQDISIQKNFRESNLHILVNVSWLSGVKVLLHFMTHPIYYSSLINSLGYSAEIRLLKEVNI